MKSEIVTVGGVAYTTFAPEAGTTFANIVIKECAAAETYAAKGSICAEMAASGVQAVQQTLKFSEVADAACSTDKLTMGGEPATLRGGVNIELTGVDEGKQWGWIATSNPAPTGHTWRVAGVNLAAGAVKTCAATSDGTMTLHGNFLGTFHLTSTAIATEGCTITQDNSGATAIATGTAAKITFSNITVDIPVGCKADPVNTNPVKSQIVTVGGVAYTTFAPGSGTTFANIVIKECAWAETYPIKGSICAEMAQSGVQAVQQTLKFSAVADTACSTDILTMGGNPATLRGGVNVELTGGDEGKSWGWVAT